MIRSTSSNVSSIDFFSRTRLHGFILFVFCLATLDASAQNHPKEIQEISPAELINPIERLAIEADHSSVFLNTKIGQETQTNISQFAAPTSLLLPSAVILEAPSTTLLSSAEAGLLGHSMQTIGSTYKNVLNQRRGRSSSAPGDMDNDGIPDNLDLCPERTDMALDFDGIDDYVAVPHDPVLNVGIGDFTFEAWVNSTKVGQQTILSKGSGHAGTDYLLTIETNSVIGFYFADEWYYGSTTIPINAWSHVAVTYDFSTKDVTFLVNGVVDVVVNYPNTPVTSDMNSLYLGQNGYSCQCLPFEGRIDDVAIWNIKRSTEEIACGIATGITGFLGLVAYYNMNDAAAAACMNNTSMSMIVDKSNSGLHDGVLNNFSLMPGCTSNWSSGRNLDSDQDGLGDGCDPYCYEDYDSDGILDPLDLCPFSRDVALDFDGIDDHITVLHNVALNVGGGDFTLQAWINPTASGWSTILSKGYGGSAITDYLFTINPSSLLGLNIKSGWTYGTTAIPLNTWSHVAVSFNFTTQEATFYLNGIADGGGSIPAQPAPTDTNSLFIGQQGYNCACNHFEGRIDDVSIWNTQRTAGEITCSMAKQLTGSEAGLVAFYEMNESPACLDNTSTTTIIDQSANGFDGLLNNFSLLPGCTSNWSSGRNLDSDQNGIGDGCDGICIPADIDRDGILDSIDLCPDYMDTALDFDGIDDHITVAHHPALNVGRGDFTFQAWVNPTSNDYKVILAKGADFNGGTNYKFDIVPASSSTYKLRFFYGNEGAPVSTTAIPLNEWNHIAMTFESTTKQAVYYLNGVADGSVNYINAPDTSDTQLLYIGRFSLNCACNHFEGRMDDVSIWNRRRTPVEIACGMTSLTGSEVGLVALYDMNESSACLDNTSTTTIVDQSPNGLGGQLNNFSLLPGCTSNWTSGRNLDSNQDGLGDGCSICFDYDMDDDGIIDSIDLCPDYMDTALDFDGIDDHITVPHHATLNVGNGDFTLQAWVNPTASGWSTILSKGYGGAAITDYLFTINPSLLLGLNIKNGWTYSNTAIPLNTWSHVAVSFNFATQQATFYLNGMADGGGSFPAQAPSTDSNPLFIGQQGYNCACNHFKGRMDDVAIWNKQRTASDLAADMASGVEASEAGLVVSYYMNEAAACLENTSITMIVDQSPNGFDGLLNNFSLLQGCTSNWSSGRNLDSDQDSIGDGCDYRCYTGLSVLYVDSSAIGGNNLGSSWADAYLSLSEALNHADQCSDIDSIHVAKGTYFPNVGGLADSRTASFMLVEGIQILGQFPTGGGDLSARDTLHQTILSGDIGIVGSSLDNVYHVVVATNITSQSSVDGFIITKGLATGEGIDGFGGGWLNDNASPKMNRCVFKDNLAIVSGGGVLNFNSSPTISNCYFTNCTSVRGGAMSNESSSPTISDCRFTGNTAVDLSNFYGVGGGVFNLTNSAPIFNTCTFTFNTAESGGGIYNEASSATINYCTFTSNTANSSRATSGGGGVANLTTSTSSFDSCVFNGNVADFGGGLYSDSSMTSLVDCQFTNNMASQRGGGVYTQVTPLIAHQVTFDSNSASSFGGGLYSKLATVSLVNCHFSNNISNQSGGGACMLSVLTADNTTFTSNTANVNGGGLYSQFDSVSLLNCQFSANTAIKRGGGVFLLSSPLDAQDIVFNNNTANIHGGGLYSEFDSVSLLHCQFIANTAAERGGGAYLGLSPLVAQNVAFADNFANNLGGGLYSEQAPVSLLGCQFSANMALERGGAVSLLSAPLNAQNVSFSNNSTNSVGGGLYSQLDSVSLLDCQFSNNSVADSTRICFGGGIYALGLPSFTISSCLFSENSATGGGGAIEFHDVTASKCQNSTFRSNQVHNGSTIGTGGAYQISGTGQTDFFNCLFESNQALGSADDGGGAIMVYGGEVHLTNSTLVNNHSATHGGAISVFNNTGVATLTNTILWNNTATTDPILYNGNGGSASINYSLFDANSCLPNVSCGPGVIYNRDPLFVDTVSVLPTGGDFRLNYPSPAINAGINDSIPAGDTTDLDGVARIMNGKVDMGAYEVYYNCNFGSSVLYVDGSAIGGNNLGTSWADAFVSLSNALYHASLCPEIDSIHVAMGTYLPDVVGFGNPRTASFMIPSGVHILGQFPTGGGMLSQRDTLFETIMSGDIGVVGDSLDNVYHVAVSINNSSQPSLNGFIITKGLANGEGEFTNGGGLYNFDGPISLLDCQFILNTASGRGGGVYSFSSSLAAQDVTFVSNAALYGGGLSTYLGSSSLKDCQFKLNTATGVGATPGFGGGALTQFSPLTAENVSFTSNTSDYGGGLFNQDDVTSLVDCNFSANRATLGGGAMSGTNTGVSEIKNSTFKFNLCHNDSTRGTGGAFQVFGLAQTNFFNCLFEANQALGSSDPGGGAIMIYGSEVNLTNSTIVNNHATTHGGAISILDSTGVATLTNTVLWNNTATTDSIIHIGNGGSANMNHSLVDANNCLPNVSCGTDMIYNQDPLFVDSVSVMPTGGDFRLRYPSLAINAGINDSIPASDTTDLNGSNRIINTTVDMGAYEFNYEFPCGVYGNLVIDDVPVFMGEYKASGLISSEGIINTNSNGPVSFNSETEIELNQGFEVKLGEIFNAVIEDPCVD